MSDAYPIRVARPDDSEAVSALLLASYSTVLARHYDRDLLAAALPFVSKANPRLLASGRFFVAQSTAGALIGCGGWSMERPGTVEIVPNEGHVRHFATHPDWLGQGVGAALMARCLTDARQHIGTVHCFSTLNAEPFYRACGFETVGPIDIAMGPTVKFPSILLKRELG
jgi:GNAT superfamily N-acetyltransferase